MDRPPRLAARLFAAQVLVIATGVLGLLGASTFVGPGLFREHASRATAPGSQALEGRLRPEDAFASSFTLAVTVGATVSLAVAAGVAWVVTRRITHPVEALARAADRVASGETRKNGPGPTATGLARDLPPPDGFAAEIDQLARSFAAMDSRLAETDRTRTRLLADFAHELRTPLATLEAYVDGLEDGVVPATPDSWEVMRSQLVRLRRLVGDLRAVAAAEEGALVLMLVDLGVSAMVSGAIGAARPRYAAKGVHLHSGTMPDLAVRGDPERLLQVLGNLLDNALRHVPSGGHVTVEAAMTDGDVAIRVRDDGEGIPPSHLELIFERFRRADPSRVASGDAGSGLGLTIARAIVRAHGGTITAASEGPGTGATFTIRLPSARPPDA